MNPLHDENGLITHEFRGTFNTIGGYNLWSFSDRGHASLTEEINYPSLEQASRLYNRMISATGGESGYFSKSNLEYLLDTVKDVGERFPRRQAIVKKAAFLLYNVIVVHPFLNGNKRTAFGLMQAFLESNGYKISSGVEEGYEFLIGIATGRIPESEVEGWIARHLTELRGK